MPQNSGVTPDGLRQFFRGEAILVNDFGHQASAFVDEIIESDGEITVNATVQVGGQHREDGKIVDYGYGYRHQSTKQVRGEAGTTKGMKLFCFADEEPTWAMGDAPGTSTPTEAVKDETEGNQGDNPVPPLDVGGTFHPADTNKDGEISKQEKKDYKQSRK